MIDGLKTTRLLKTTERFESFEADLNGHRVFAKHAKSGNTAVHLKFQSKNSQTVDSIGAKLLRAPKILEINEEWIVTEWVDGSSLEAMVHAQPEHAAETLARIINIFDSQPDSTTPLRPIFTHDGLAERIRERIAPPIQQDAGQLFEESLARFREIQSKLKACLQDADVQPEHLFADPSSEAEYILIDSEHLNTHWPRFYDLANNYSKYWKRDNRTFASQTLKSYLSITSRQPEEIFEPLCASLIVRALALHWENDYDPGALDTNIPRSQSLLKRILQADSLNNLL
jgi:hypothetical protein